SLPPGFKMHVFAGEPDIRQPIAFCLDDRGRVWVAEGYTYPRRHGNPPTDNRPAGAERGKPTAEQLEDIFGGADRILVLEVPDGWLYGCHGVFCPSHVGKPEAPESERQWMDAGVWRYHPVRHVFEVFTEGGSNPWGIDFNEYGQLFAEMCVIPHFWHMIQGAR